MKKDEWVATLRPGDRVAIRRKWEPTYDIYRVASVTPSGCVRIALTDTATWEFNPDGWLRGAGQWGQTRIEPVTQLVRDINRRAKLRERISKAEWGRIDIAVLEKIVAMLPDETEVKTDKS